MNSSSVVIRRRTVQVFSFLAAAIFVLALRVGYLQIFKGDELQQQALKNRERTVRVEGKRGAILDRQGRELAVSIDTPSVAVFPPEVRRSGREKEVAAQLARILQLPEERVLALVTDTKGYNWVKRKVGFEQGEAIKKLQLPGVWLVDEGQRYYPNDRLASQVLGFAGIDNQGLAGLEVAFDKELRGEPGSLVVEVDAVGREIPQSTHRYTPPKDGNTLVLTLDATIQYIAERELDQLMQSPTNPAHASVLVMDVPTGEILALANRPDYDPNRYGDFPSETWRNFAASYTYEPGSVFKIVTISAALEEGVVKQEERFYDPGYIMVGKERIRCWKDGGHGSQTFAEGVQNSCNPVFVQVGLRLDQKKKGTFSKYIRDFGFGQRTGVEFSEEAGIVRPENKLKEINLATISIGQGISVTPLQMITAASAVANKGLLMRPHLLKEVRDRNGLVLQRVQPQPVRQVVTKETAAKVSELLEGVVARGTGINAYLEGYRVGGKTGTAQKAGKGGYQPGRYVSSFLGFAPVNDPRLAVLVVIDEPKGIYYGGQIAAPVFKHVMLDSLRYLKVPAQFDPTVPKKENPEEQSVVVPEVRGLSPERAEQALRAMGLAPVRQGGGPVVLRQTPQSPARLKLGSQVLLYLGQGGTPPSQVEVPDLTGQRLPNAAALLEALGLRLEAHGSGVAKEQEPVPGARLPAGDRVKVHFEELPVQGPLLGP